MATSDESSHPPPRVPASRPAPVSAIDSADAMRNPSLTIRSNLSSSTAIPLTARPRGQKRKSAEPHPAGLDASQVAVDFVLDLEKPCLRHHRTDRSSYGEPDGHLMMVQAPLMARCPPVISKASKRAKLDTSVTWTCPTSEIHKTIKAPVRLSIEGEITPIEAWQRITGHPAFATMDHSRLQALKAVLLPEVQCYGFGAVIDEDYFEELLERQLSPAVSFPDEQPPITSSHEQENLLEACSS